MKAQDWMTRDVATCRPETGMNEAAHSMWTGDYGVLPVVGPGGRVMGMITDRDLCMSACFRGKPLAEMQVAEAMSPEVYACQASDSIEVVLQRMGECRVRRLPVLDDEGRLAGILSLNDVACRIAALGGRERARLVPRLAEALAGVCESRKCAVPRSPSKAATPEATPSARKPVAAG